VSLAEEKPELVPDESLAVIAKGARSGPALEAKNILLQRNPPAQKRTRRQTEPAMTPAEVEAHVHELAEVMHLLNLPASALLAIEEASDLISAAKAKKVAAAVSAANKAIRSIRSGLFDS
jgi:cytochrome P450